MSKYVVCLFEGFFNCVFFLQTSLFDLIIQFENIHVIFRYWIMHLRGFLISVADYKTNEQLNYALDIKRKTIKFRLAFRGE